MKMRAPSIPLITVDEDGRATCTQAYEQRTEEEDTRTYRRFPMLRTRPRDSTSTMPPSGVMASTSRCRSLYPV